MRTIRFTVEHIAHGLKRAECGAYSFQEIRSEPANREAAADEHVAQVVVCVMDVGAPLGGDPDTTAVAQTTQPALNHPVVPAQPTSARAAALSGDKKQAIVYAGKALAHAPDDAHRPNLEDLISE